MKYVTQQGTPLSNIDVYTWYKAKTAEQRNRNLLQYGSETRRGKHEAFKLLWILQSLDGWLKNLHGISGRGFLGVRR